MSVIVGLFILVAWSRMQSSKAQLVSFVSDYPVHLTDQFPETSEIVWVKEIRSSKSYLQAAVKFKEKYVDYFKAKHGESLTEISYQSDSVFILDRNILAGETKIISESKLLEELKYPLPNFRIYTREDTSFYKWKHYILESKFNQDSVVHVEMYFENDSILMQLEHGYSKGISVNQEANLIIYWLELW